VKTATLTVTVDDLGWRLGKTNRDVTTWWERFQELRNNVSEIVGFGRVFAHAGILPHERGKGKVG